MYTSSRSLRNGCGALNLNVHIHALVLDGVFARGDDGSLRFHAAPALDAADVADVLAAILGPELICPVGESLIWSRVIRPPATVADELDTARRAFEDRGWTLATDPPKR